MIKHIEFAYSEGVRKDANREANMTNNINMWLQPLVEEINKQEGIVFVIFSTYDTQTFEVDGISIELKKRVFERLDSFKHPSQ
jgi:hypothetical protein